MAVAGELLIQIAADTKRLASGLDDGRKQVETFAGHVRSLRSEMRFLRAAASVTGAAVAKAWATQAIQEYVGGLQELQRKSVETGKSIEELSHGEILTSQVKTIMEMAHAMEQLKSSTAAWVVSLAESSGVLGFLKDALELNAALISGKDSTRIRAEAGSAGLEETIKREEKARAAAKKKADEETARAEKDAVESRNKVFSGVQSVLSGLQKQRDKLVMGEDGALAKSLRQKGALPFEIERAVALQKEIEGIKEREKAAKDAAEKKSRHDKELDKWAQEEEQRRAQIALDEMEALEKARKDRMEKAADIVKGRDGIGAAERGTQAAFSAINKTRVNVAQKQLTALERIEKNTRTQAAGQQLEAADL